MKMEKPNGNAYSNINHIAVAAASATLLFWVALSIFERHETREKMSSLHFYFHDQSSGANVTSVKVASPTTTEFPRTLFGTVMVIDNWLTEGPEPTSKMMGRTEGIYVFASQRTVRLFMAFTVVLESGENNGSTLSVIGNNPFYEEVREMPIVGGSGVFRSARGHAFARTYSSNQTASNAVVQYTLNVFHY